MQYLNSVGRHEARRGSWDLLASLLMATWALTKWVCRWVFISFNVTMDIWHWKWHLLSIYLHYLIFLYTDTLNRAAASLVLGDGLTHQRIWGKMLCSQNCTKEIGKLPPRSVTWPSSCRLWESLGSVLCQAQFCWSNISVIWSGVWAALQQWPKPNPCEVNVEIDRQIWYYTSWKIK